MRRLLILAAALLVAIAVLAQSESDKLSSAKAVDVALAQGAVTKAISPAEWYKAGLHKLTPREIYSLNDVLLELMGKVANSKDDTGKSGQPRQTMRTRSSDDGEISLIDSAGREVAYIAEDDDLTIYLWGGKPVAYISGESVYGFNGKHLGWFVQGALHENDGDIALVTAGRFSGAISSNGYKAYKEYKPYKSYKEYKPYKPTFHSSWARTPGRILIARGAD